MKNIALQITMVFWALAAFPIDARAANDNAEANEMFTNAVLLYRQAETQGEAEARRTYAEVKQLIDTILSEHPNTLQAQRLAEGGIVAGMDLSKLSSDLPIGWNDGKRRLVHDLLEVYGHDVRRLERVAEAAEYAFLACAAYHEEGRTCGDEHAMTSGVGTETIGWTPVRVFRDQNLGVGELVAFLYAHEDGRHALVYRGTDEPLDFVTNILATMDASFYNAGQLDFAREVASFWVEEYPNLIFAGHSLGGRLAQIATLETGRPSYVFNTAPKGAWERARYEHLWESSKSKFNKFRSPDDPVSLLDLQQGESHIEVSNIARTGDGFLRNLDGANEHGYVHTSSVLAEAMATVANYYANGWVQAFLSEAQATKTEASASLIGEIGTIPGLYAIDPALCTVEASVGDAWGTLFQSISGSSVQRASERDCDLVSVNVDGDRVEMTANCLVEGETEIESWAWQVTSETAFSETEGRHAGKSYTRCGAEVATETAQNLDAQAENNFEVFEPARGSLLRSTLLEILRPIAEEAFGAPVQFLVDTLNVSDDIAMASVRAIRPGGGEIALKETSIYQRGELILELGTPNEIQALLIQRASGWSVEQSVIQPTEAWWLEYCERFGRLFPSNCAPAIQTADNSEPNASTEALDGSQQLRNASEEEEENPKVQKAFQEFRSLAAGSHEYGWKLLYLENCVLFDHTYVLDHTGWQGWHDQILVDLVRLDDEKTVTLQKIGNKLLVRLVMPRGEDIKYSSGYKGSKDPIGRLPEKLSPPLGIDRDIRKAMLVDKSAFLQVYPNTIGTFNTGSSRIYDYNVAKLWREDQKEIVVAFQNLIDACKQ